LSSNYQNLNANWRTAISNQYVPKCCGFCSWDIGLWFITGVGNPRPAGLIRPVKQNNLARLVPNCSNCVARLVVLYFMNLPSLQIPVFHSYVEILPDAGLCSKCTVLGTCKCTVCRILGFGFGYELWRSKVNLIAIL